MTGLNYIFLQVIIFILGVIVGRVAIAAIEALPENKMLFFKNLHNIRFSLSSLLVQLVVGVIFVLIYNKYGITAEFIFFIYIMLILLIMFFIDLRTKTIPNELVIIGVLGGLIAFIYNIFIPLKVYPTSNWWEPLIGILPGSGILLAIAILGAIIYKSDDVMGMGDVKIFLPIGLILGFRLAVMSLIFSVFIGGFAGLFLIITGLKNRKSQIPFGPFIVSGTFLAILFGHEIISWYLGFL